MSSPGDAPDTVEEWMRGINKDSALQSRRGNPMPLIGIAGITPSVFVAGSTTAPLFWDQGTVIVFPDGMFTDIPVVTVAAVPTPVGGVMWASIVSISATQMVVQIVRMNGAPVANTPIHWTARPAS